jgi:Tfp pilus assembly protein PilF
MTRILTEQGVDEAITYVGTQRSSIFQTVRARAATARERNRADLQPLLQTAALHQAKGQVAEARTLYTDILSIEPDWPEVLHAYFWFLADQGDLARVRTTLAEASRDYEDARLIAQRLAASDPRNIQWQRDLTVANWKLADLAERQKRTSEAHTYWKQAFDVLSGIEQRGLHLSPDDRQWLETLRVKIGADAG